MSRALHMMARMRRIAVEEARVHLAECIAVETEAAEAVRRINDQIARERAAATALDGPDSLVEAFAAWLPGCLEGLAAARAAAENAAAATAIARARFNAARAGAEAVEQRIAALAAAEAEARRKREQQQLDEAASRRAL